MARHAVRSLIGAAILTAVLAVPSGQGAWGGLSDRPAPARLAAESVEVDPIPVPGSRRGVRRAEQRYRVDGKVRMLLFWLEREDVGGARIRWEFSPEESSVALLAGSNPDRAPSRLNQWVYLREETDGPVARVFVLRSLTEAESAASPREAVLDGPQFGASCTTLTPALVRTAAATVTAARGLTYDRFGPVLDRVVESTQWTAKRGPRPPGSEVGFLTALERLLTLADASPSAWRSVPYVYNHVAYDLAVVRTEGEGARTIAGRPYAHLVAADLAVRNRETRYVTRFRIRYAPREVGGGVTVPVQIVYQPNWWLKIELSLDDRVDLPVDPATDAVTLARIHDVCARATE
ncbi:MAG: hypothetical protein AB7N65_27365 [Vicinamibacterales bacterium]